MLYNTFVFISAYDYSTKGVLGRIKIKKTH